MSRKIDTSGKTGLSPEQATARQGGKLLFTTYEDQQAAFLIRDDRLCAARFFPCAQSRVGAVYICKVKNAAKNIGAYFVEIGEEREICFLSGKDAAYPCLLNRVYDGRILAGDEFPVQVTRDAAKGKQASVTTLISISNPYFALSVGKRGIGYSAKLSKEQRERLKDLLTQWQEDTGYELPTGLVVRTRAAELTDLTALQNLSAQWEGLFRTAAHRVCFSCLLEAPSPWEAVLEQLVYPDEYEEILTDDRNLYEKLLTLDSIPANKKVRLYDETQSKALSMDKLYGLESKLDTALGRRVWLKSGGYLLIEPTEAMTVIDVNSGKYEAGKEAEETYAHINREAAGEIARQLRLRNLSGIIVVDFINMKSTERQEALLDELRTLIRRDKQKTVVVDMTPLGLVEITRKKDGKPLAEQIAFVKRRGGAQDGIKTD